MTLIKLKEISTKIGSGATPKGGKEAYKSEGISLIRSMNVYDNQFKEKDLAFIDDSQAIKLSNVVVEPLDILLNITGASVARCCLVPEKILPARVNQHVAIIRIDKNVADPRFIYMCMVSPKYKSKLLSLAQGGATREALTKITIEEFELELPPITTQKFIADLYLAYDNLIENNNRRIAILEYMAQSLYREWFVNFRYPNYEDNLDADGNPKLIDSPLGQIPEGWEVKEIGSVAKVKGGKRLPKGKKVLDVDTGLPYLRVKDFTEIGIDRSDIKYIDKESHLATKKYIISCEDLYISIAGTIGRVGIIPSDLDKSNLTENAAKICEFIDLSFQSYVLRFLRSYMGQKNLQARTSGSSQPKLALYKISEMPLLIPPKELLCEFSRVTSQFEKLIEKLDKKNDNLKKQRDMLLPKLISGQIELKG